MRKSVQKALANQQWGHTKSPKGPPNDSLGRKTKPGDGPKYSSPDKGSERLLKSDARTTRAMRKRVIEDEYGHVPIR